VETIKIEDRTYAVVQILNFNFMNTYEIICTDEIYSDVIAGPYLTIEEAIKDLRSVAEMHEKMNTRPVKKVKKVLDNS